MKTKTARRPSRLGMFLVSALMILSTLAWSSSGSAGFAQGTADSPGMSFRGNAARTGEMPGPGPTGDEPVVAWSFELGQAVHSSPVIDDGVVYAQGDEFIFAVDAQTGLERWRFASGGNTYMPGPAVVDGTVYAQLDYGLVALDAATGTERWRVDLDENSSATQPAIVDGVVFVRTEGGVSAFDAVSGSAVWRWNHSSSETGKPAPVTVANGMVFVVNGWDFFALDAASGTERWSREVHSNLSLPVVAGERIVIDTDTDLVAIDASSGDDVWATPCSHYTDGFNAIATDGVAAYALCGGDLVAFTLDTGAEQWRLSMGGEDQTIAGSVSVAAGVVYLGTVDDVVAVNVQTGEELWSIYLPEIRGTISVSGGLLYVDATETDSADRSIGQLYALGSASADCDPAADWYEATGERFAAANTAVEPLYDLADPSTIPPTEDLTAIGNDPDRILAEQRESNPPAIAGSSNDAAIAFLEALVTRVTTLAEAQASGDQAAVQTAIDEFIKFLQGSDEMDRMNDAIAGLVEACPELE